MTAGKVYRPGFCTFRNDGSNRQVLRLTVRIDDPQPFEPQLIAPNRELDGSKRTFLAPDANDVLAFQKSDLGASQFLPGARTGTWTEAAFTADEFDPRRTERTIDDFDFTQPPRASGQIDRRQTRFPPARSCRRARARPRCCRSAC